MSKPLVVAFDPSIDCTGWAVVYGGSLLDAGAIRPKHGVDLYARGWSLREQARAVLERMERGRGGITTVAVEFPQTVSRGLGGKRSAASLPTYGLAVGALVYGLALPAGVRMLTPSATEWTRGYPSTNGDRHKLRRVAFAESLYGLKAGALGAKSVAGNVADAVLLAHWAVGREMGATDAA